MKLTRCVIAFKSFEKYKNYKTIIIVTHGMLMRQLDEKIDFYKWLSVR